MSKHYRPRYRIERADREVIGFISGDPLTPDLRTEQQWWATEVTDPEADPHGPFPTHGDALAFALGEVA